MPISLKTLTVRKGRGTRYYKADGTEVCGVQLRGKGKDVRCSQSKGVAPNGRCRLHGGAKGSGRPVTVDRWGNAAGRMAEAYGRAKEDPALFDPERPLAILDTQVAAALRMADEADCPDFRKRALAALHALKAAHADGDPVATQAAIVALEEILEAGAKEIEVSEHVVRMTERYSKRLEKFWDIKLSRMNSVNAKDLTSILGRLVDAVQQAAPPEVSRRILHHLDSEFRDIAGQLEPREVEVETKPKKKRKA